MTASPRTQVWVLFNESGLPSAATGSEEDAVELCKLHKGMTIRQCITLDDAVGAVDDIERRTSYGAMARKMLGRVRVALHRVAHDIRKLDP